MPVVLLMKWQNLAFEVAPERDERFITLNVPIKCHPTCFLRLLDRLTRSSAASFIFLKNMAEMASQICRHCNLLIFGCDLLRCDHSDNSAWNILLKFT